MLSIFVCILATCMVQNSFADLELRGHLKTDAANSIYHHDNRLYRGCGMLLETWEISSGEAHRINVFEFDGTIMDILPIADDIAILTADGLTHTISHVQTGLPELLWTSEVAVDCPRHLLSYQDRLLVIAETSDWYSFSTGENPQFIDSFDGAWAALAVGDTLLMDVTFGCSTGGWCITPAFNWVQLSETGPVNLETYSPPFDGSLFRNAWIATTDRLFLHSEYALHALDRNDFTNIEEISSGVYFYDIGIEGKIALAEDVLWIGGNNGISSIDISENEMSLINTWELANVRDLESVDSLLLVNQSDASVYYSYQDPASIVEELSIPANGIVRDFELNADLSLLRYDVLKVVRNTENGSELLSELPLGDGNLLATADDLAIANVEDSLAVIDISVPHFPQLVSTLQMGEISSLNILGTTAVIQVGLELVCLDLAIPTNPIEIARFQTGDVSHISAIGQYIAVGIQNDRIQNFKVQDQQVIEWNSVSYSAKFALCGDRLLRAYMVYDDDLEDTHVEVWDLSNPELAELESERVFEDVHLFEINEGADRFGLVLGSLSYFSFSPAYFTMFDVVEMTSITQTQSIEREKAGTRYCIGKHADDSGSLLINPPDQGVYLYYDSSIVDVKKDLTQPRDFTLSVYPNPFNPQTNIQFSLVSASHVSLSLYDLQGRLTRVIHDGLLSSGSHSFQINAQRMSSGIYFLKLDSALLSKTQKLILLQ
jgi:hypothetical protein